jgi:hypothetical protein
MIVRMFAFRDPGCAIVADPTARCVACESAEHLVEGDGAPVCRVCIDELGHAAGDPIRSEVELLQALADRHRDVVSLTRVASNTEPLRFEWAWTDRWPGVEAHS